MKLDQLIDLISELDAFFWCHSHNLGGTNRTYSNFYYLVGIAISGTLESAC